MSDPFEPPTSPTVKGSTFDTADTDDSLPPSTPTNAAKPTSKPSPALSDGIVDSLADPERYIAPDQQDMMLPDITSSVLHREKHGIGRGKEYLSSAELNESFGNSWPVMGVIFGNNGRLMINLPTRRRGKNPNTYETLNVFYLVDTGSPNSYLCQEAMNALIARKLDYQPQRLTVCVQAEGKSINMHLSPLLSPDGSPGKFHDVNVLGMDFLRIYGLTMKVHAPAGRFKLYLHAVYG